MGEFVHAQGAKVTVTTPTKTLTEWLVTGEGLASDQTALLQFGLGKETRVSNVKIWLTNDKEISIDSPNVNTVIDVKAEVEKHKLNADISEENVQQN